MLYKRLTRGIKQLTMWRNSEAVESAAALLSSMDLSTSMYDWTSSSSWNKHEHQLKNSNNLTEEFPGQIDINRYIPKPIIKNIKNNTIYSILITSLSNSNCGIIFQSSMSKHNSNFVSAIEIFSSIITCWTPNVMITTKLIKQ